MVYKQKNSNRWWYKFVWNGKLIRESTKQTNKRIAEQMEAAHKAALAKGEVGIRDKVQVPTLADFAAKDFLPFIDARFIEKRNTLSFYRNGVKNLLAFAALGQAKLDAITSDKITGYIQSRRQKGLQVASINRELQVLRSMFRLAVEWDKLEKVPPKVELLSGERRRDRVLTSDEEHEYFRAAQIIGEDIENAYSRALEGIRAMRGQEPIKPEDPFLLRDLTALLIDCGLRPEEAFRLRWDEVRDGAVHIAYGKTINARRRIPLTQRVLALLEMRRSCAGSEWVFPAHTASGHAEKSTPKKQHKRACALARVQPFTLYTFRHTCLTRWAAHMDPYTLAYLAGHSDFGMTRRYVHPQADTVRAAMERAQAAGGGHSFGHSGQKADITTSGQNSQVIDFRREIGRGEWIRTTDLLVPNQAL